MASSSSWINKLKVFISYPASDGSSFANEAANVLKQEGYRVWIYTNHRTLGALVWDEISDVIFNKTDIFLFLCTESSLKSDPAWVNGASGNT